MLKFEYEGSSPEIPEELLRAFSELPLKQEVSLSHTFDEDEWYPVQTLVHDGIHHFFANGSYMYSHGEGSNKYFYTREELEPVFNSILEKIKEKL